MIGYVSKCPFRRYKCAMNDNTVLFSSLLLDACIVPVSVPVCHLDSRQQQQQQQPSLMNNQQHQLQHQQNNPPHLAYQQANHHSYTTVTTSNQHGPTPMGAHQQGPVPPHLQQQVSSLLSIQKFSLLLFAMLSIFLSQIFQTVQTSFALLCFNSLVTGYFSTYPLVFFYYFSFTNEKKNPKSPMAFNNLRIKKMFNDSGMFLMAII